MESPIPVAPVDSTQQPDAQTNPSGETLIPVSYVFFIVEFVPLLTYLLLTLWRGLDLQLGYLAIMASGAAAIGGGVLWWLVFGAAEKVSWSKAALVGTVGAGILPFLSIYFGMVLFIFLRGAADSQSGPVLSSNTLGDELLEILGAVIVGLIYVWAMFFPIVIYMTVMGFIAGLICPLRTSISNTTTKYLRNANPWALQVAMVGVVFAALGFLTAVMLFQDRQMRMAAVSAGLSGATAWGIVCGRYHTPSLGRTVLTGILAGILVHPCFWLLVYDPPAPGGYTNPEDLGIYRNSLGSFNNFGLATICLSITVVFVCRRVGRYWHRLIEVLMSNE